MLAVTSQCHYTHNAHSCQMNYDQNTGDTGDRLAVLPVLTMTCDKAFLSCFTSKAVIQYVSQRDGGTKECFQLMLRLSVT